MIQSNTGWLLYRRGDIDRNRFFIDRLSHHLMIRGIAAETKAIEDLSIDIYAYGRLPAFVINRSFNPITAALFEGLGVPCFNPFKIALPGNDKAIGSAVALRLGIPIPRSRLYYGGDSPWSPPDATTVSKPVDSHGGSGVTRTQGADDQYISKATPELPVLVQEYIPGGSTDHRCYVFSGKPKIWVKRSAQSRDEFRSNLSIGGAVSEHSPEPQEMEMARVLADYLGQGNYAIDFLESDRGSLFGEIEDVCGYRSLYQLNLCDPAELLSEQVLAHLDQS